MLFCRKKITAKLDFLLKIPDNIIKHRLEVPLCYVNLRLQTIGGSSRE